MAGRATVFHGGLTFRAGPDFWLRRLIRFPFYFASSNPSFRVDIERVADPPSDEDWPDGAIGFEVHFDDDTITGIRIEVPELRLRQKATLKLGNIYTSYPGQTIIRIVTKPQAPGRRAEWKTLYSYQVRTEEQLWLAFFGPFGCLLFGIGATVLGVLIQSSLD